MLGWLLVRLPWAVALGPDLAPCVVFVVTPTSVPSFGHRVRGAGRGGVAGRPREHEGAAGAAPEDGRLVDVAPTVVVLSRVRPPADAQGGVPGGLLYG